MFHILQVRIAANQNGHIGKRRFGNNKGVINFFLWQKTTRPNFSGRFFDNPAANRNAVHKVKAPWFTQISQCLACQKLGFI